MSIGLPQQKLSKIRQKVYQTVTSEKVFLRQNLFDKSSQKLKFENRIISSPNGTYLFC